MAKNLKNSPEKASEVSDRPSRKNAKKNPDKRNPDPDDPNEEKGPPIKEMPSKERDAS